MTPEQEQKIYIAAGFDADRVVLIKNIILEAEKELMDNLVVLKLYDDNGDEELKIIDKRKLNSNKI